MRKCTGLHNRNRTGRSTYSKKHKGLVADKYGKWESGKRKSAEVIASRTMNYVLVREKDNADYPYSGQTRDFAEAA